MRTKKYFYFFLLTLFLLSTHVALADQTWYSGTYLGSAPTLSSTNNGSSITYTGSKSAAYCSGTSCSSYYNIFMQFDLGSTTAVTAGDTISFDYIVHATTTAGSGNSYVRFNMLPGTGTYASGLTGNYGSNAFSESSAGSYNLSGTFTGTANNTTTGLLLLDLTIDKSQAVDYTITINNIYRNGVKLFPVSLPGSISQTNNTAVATENLQSDNYGEMLHGFTGSISSTSMEYYVASGNYQYSSIQIQQYDSYTAYVTGAGSSSATYTPTSYTRTSLGSNKYKVTGSFTTPVVLDPSKYYNVTMYGSNLGFGSSWYALGSTLDTLPNAAYLQSPGAIAGSLSDAYLVMSGSGIATSTATSTGLAATSTVNEILGPGYTSLGLNTHFSGLSFSSVSTTSVDAHSSWFIDSNEVNTGYSATDPSEVQILLATSSNATLTDSAATVRLVHPVMSWGNGSTTFTATGLHNGTYDVYVSFTNPGVSSGSNPPFPMLYMMGSFTLTDGTLSATSTSNYNALNPPALGSRATLQACGLSSLDGCLFNVGYELFVPTSTDFYYFQQIPSLIATRQPFQTFYQIAAASRVVASSSFDQTPTTLTLNLEKNPIYHGDLTILSPSTTDMFIGTAQRDLFVTLMGISLWLGFFIYVIFTVRIALRSQ